MTESELLLSAEDLHLRAEQYAKKSPLLRLTGAASLKQETTDLQAIAMKMPPSRDSSSALQILLVTERCLIDSSRTPALLIALLFFLVIVTLLFVNTF